MKNIWLLTKTNMKRNLWTIIIALLGAAMLCFVIYAMGKMIADHTVAKIKIGYMDHDNSVLSEDFERYLTEQLNYELYENNSYEVLSTELIDKHISAIIEVPENFYADTSKGRIKPFVITTLDDYENAAFFEVYVNSYLGSIKVLSDSAAGDEKLFDELLSTYQKEQTRMAHSAAITIDKSLLAQKAGFINSIGFYLMFIFGVSVSYTFIILDDRLSGVLNRIQVTPVKPSQYIIGSAIFGTIVCFIMSGIFCTYIKIMNIQTGVPFGIILLLMTLFSIFTVCFSMATALTLHSKNAVTSMIIGFSTFGCILGGAYFPIEMAPKSLQNLARILPQFWFMDTFRKLQADSLANVFPNIIVLILFIVLTFLIGAVVFSQNYKNR
ncbi:MAG: transporter permease [Herbinix sp.]|nr:transporter permease [Herbinix sp.]